MTEPVAAGHAAENLGGRVALKAAGPAIVHKTDLDAVRVGLEGAAEVSWAAVEMDEALNGAGVERQSFTVAVNTNAEISSLLTWQAVVAAYDKASPNARPCGAG